MCASGFLFPTGKTIDQGEPSLCGCVGLRKGDMVKVKLLLLSSNAAFLDFFGCCCLFFVFFMWCKGMIHSHPWSLGFSQRRSYLWIVARFSVKGNNAKDFLFCHLLILLQKDFGRNWQLE